MTILIQILLLLCLLPFRADGGSISSFAQRRNVQESNYTNEPRQLPPTRECGQIINTVAVTQIQELASMFVNQIFSNDPVSAGIGESLVDSLVRYGVQAQVVCASCNEVRSTFDGAMATFRDSNEQDRFSFQHYCGKDRFAANVTYSGLLLIPMDPDSGLPLKGELKSHVSMTSFTLGEQEGAASEYWVQDFDAFNASDPINLMETFSSFREGLLSLLKASTGIIVVSPDYLGFGHSYNSTRGTGVLDLYQQATAVGFLKSKFTVESTGCTAMGNQTSVSGYSEGGIASIAGALALQGLGQQILNVDSGGAPFHLSKQMVHSISQGGNNTSLRVEAAIFASSFSSQNPDLPNTNENQNILNNDWLEPIQTLADASTTFDFVASVLPKPWTDILAVEVLDKTLELLAQNQSDFCFNSTPGVDDILCQTLYENSYIDLLENATFPISICHSADDEIVPVSNVPNMSANPLLYEATLLGQRASGSHVMAAAFCSFFQLSQFTSFASSPFPLSGVISSNVANETVTCTNQDSAFSPPAPTAPTAMPAPTAPTAMPAPSVMSNSQPLASSASSITIGILLLLPAL